MLPNRGKITASIDAGIARMGRGQIPVSPGLFGQEARERDLVPRARTLDTVATAEEARKVPQATYDAGRYGDFSTVNVFIPANQSALALPRPATKRILLVVQNTTAAPLFYAFDGLADTASLSIPAGFTLFLDAAVPQNNLYLFSGAVAVAVPVGFINLDIENAR